jgi:CxxC motif-containing protein
MENGIRELTCIVCPRGCTLRVEQRDGEMTVSGNSCPRGKQYGLDECTHPVRTLTTTARTTAGTVIPVKTDRPIPKELMMAAMREIDKQVVPLPAHIGDVVMENLAGTGVRVVVTANRSGS